MIERFARGTDPRDVARAAALVARLALKRPDTRLWAQRALRPHLPPAGEADADGRWYSAAIGQWAKTIATHREPAALGEIVTAPWRVIAYRIGDCDDLAAAAATIAAVAGIEAWIAVYPTGPGTAHCVAVIGRDWNGSPPTYAIDHTGRTPFSAPQAYIARVTT